MILIIEQNDSYIDIIIACISAGISLLAFIFSWISFTKSNATAKIEYEYSNFTIITNTKDKIVDISKMIIPLLVKERLGQLDPVETETLVAYRALLDTALENNLNAYEEACSKFLDKKVDNKRFKSLYRNEIVGLFDDEEYSSFLSDSSTKYINIKKTYNKLTGNGHFRTEFLSE